MTDRKDIAEIEIRYRFTELDRIMIDGVEHAWDCDTDNGVIFIETGGRHRATSLERPEIREYIDKGRLTVEVGYHLAREAERRSKLGNRLLHQMPDKALEKALWKQTWCDLLIEVKGRQRVRMSNGKLKPLMDTIREEYYARNKASLEAVGKSLQHTNRQPYELKAPAAKTLRDWYAQYVAGDFSVAALFDGKGGNPGSHFTPEERHLHALFVLKYASRSRPSIAHLHRRMCAAFLRINRSRKEQGLPELRPLGETWFRQKINDLPDFFKMAGRFGERRARLYFQAIMRGAPKRVPMQRLEADEWKVDLHTFLIDTGLWYELTPKERQAYETVRLWFSAIICTATKCIVGLRIYSEAPSINSAFETLEMTSRNKTDIAKAAGCRFPWEMHGGLRTMSTDSGVWYTSAAYRATLIDAGCSAVYPPSGEAYMRGTIERFFRTIAQLGLQEFTARTFSNVVDKGEGDPAAEASVRTDLLIKVFIRLIVDVYHNTPHAGIGGMTPRQAWRTMTRDHWPKPPLTGDLARNVFGTPHRAKVTRAGIVFHSIQYQSKPLQLLRQDDKDVWVDFRVNPRDLSSISVSIGETYMPVRATLKGLENISLFRWLAACEQLRIYDREQLDMVRADVAAALEWASEQAEVAQAEMGMSSQSLDLEKYDYLQEKQLRFMTIRDDHAWEGSKALERARTSAGLAKLLGYASKLKPMPEKVENLVQSNGAERRRKPQPVSVAPVPAPFIPADDDEFAPSSRKDK